MMDAARAMWTTDGRIWPVALTMCLNGVAEVAMKPITPAMLGSLGITDMEHGLVVTAFSLTKLVSNEPAAWVANTLGRRAAMCLGLAVEAVGVLVLARATGAAGVGLGRAIQGGGGVLVGMGKTLAASDMATTKTRASTQAPLYAAFKVGALVGPVAGGRLATAGHSRALAVVAALYALDAGLTRCWASETLQGTVAARPNDIREKSATPTTTGAVARLCAVNAAAWFAVGGAANAVVPPFLAARGAAPRAGRIYTYEAVVGVLTPLAVAGLADAVGPDRLVAPSLLLAAAANLLFLTNTTAAVALAAVPAAIVFSSLRAALLNVAPPRSGTALARFQIAGDLGLLLSSLVLSSISSTRGYEATFLFLALWLLAFALLFLRTPLAPHQHQHQGGTPTTGTTKRSATASSWKTRSPHLSSSS